MSASDYIKQLNSLREEVKVSPDWKSAQRDVLLSKISSQSSTYQGNLFGQMLHFNTRLAFKPVVFVMLVVVFFGGVIASVSASSSLPGEMLYSVKLTTEKIQVSLVRDEDKKADLQLKLAKKRIEEIKVVAKTVNNAQKKEEILKTPVKEYKKTIEDLQKTVTAKSIDDKESAVKLAINIKDATKEVKVAIASASKDSEQSGVKEILEDVNVTTKNAELDAVVTIATTSVNEEEVKNTLVEYIDSIQADNEIKTVEVVDKTISDTDEVVVNNDEKITQDTKNNENTTIVTDETNKANQITTDAVATDTKVDTVATTNKSATGGLTQTAVQEVKALLDTNNIQLAVQVIEKAAGTSIKSTTTTTDLQTGVIEVTTQEVKSTDEKTTEDANEQEDAVSDVITTDGAVKETGTTTQKVSQ